MRNEEQEQYTHTHTPHSWGTTIKYNDMDDIEVEDIHTTHTHKVNMEEEVIYESKKYARYFFHLKRVTHIWMQRVCLCDLSVDSCTMKVSYWILVDFIKRWIVLVIKTKTSHRGLEDTGCIERETTKCHVYNTLCRFLWSLYVNRSQPLIQNTFNFHRTTFFFLLTSILFDDYHILENNNRLMNY